MAKESGFSVSLPVEEMREETGWGGGGGGVSRGRLRVGTCSAEGAS